MRVAAGRLIAPASEQQEETILEKNFINPDTLADFSAFFSQIATVESGGTKTIHVSGQVAVDKEGNLVGGDDLAAQADQAFKNVTLALEAAGATPEDVIKINVYAKGPTPESRPIGRAMNKYFTQKKNRPASTWVWVASLVDPRYLIEVEVVAVVEG